MTTLSQLYQEAYVAVNSTEVTTWSAVYRLTLAMLLGACVGFERKRKGQTAGVRTFSLICMGAALAMILSIYVPQEYLGLKNGDPSRIAAQVVSGIGFLGAGAIIQMKGSVRGLTTAAGIWMIAAIGMAVGVGMYWVATIASGLILFILLLLERFEHRIRIGSEMRIIRLMLSCVVEDISGYRKVLEANRIKFTNYYIEYDYQQNKTRLNLVVIIPDELDMIKLFKELRAIFPTDAVSLANQVSI
ncbi:MAG: MgtC/SapB family protein [Muribaculaceae bacterium]|nr:MgtC/SapB family protein [Bacteroidales bacterium]MDD6723247.1 MgtC/SapB family protein [Bacteroidales bacterium]